jgi:hypothetical protein
MTNGTMKLRDHENAARVAAMSPTSMEGFMCGLYRDGTPPGCLGWLPGRPFVKMAAASHGYPAERVVLALEEHYMDAHFTLLPPS